jgi:hypothetical protein
MAETLSVHQMLYIRNLLRLIGLLNFGGRGSCCQ